MIIRLKSKIGISRIILDEDSTLMDDEKRLNEIGIIHGTSIILDNNIDEISYKTIVNNIKSENEPEEIDLTNTQSNDSITNTQLENEKIDGPLFKSFDAYLHENGFEIGDLPLMNSFLPIKIKRGIINKLPKSITIRHQKYRHVDHLEMMNVEEVRRFANFWLNELQMSLQRIGWMYGYYTEDQHYPYGIRAVCEAIYEPPQYSNINDVIMIEDEMLMNVDKIAERLGLERIGMIFTRLPNECFLTARELIRVIEMQYNSLKHIHYTGYPISTMVTCTMSPDDNGQPVLNAYMASDLALALFRDELFTSSQSFNHIISTKCNIHHDSTNNSSRGSSGSSTNTTGGSGTEEVIRELMPILIESGKEVVDFDTSWLIVRINESAPIKPNSFFPKLTIPFPIENRNTNSTNTNSTNSNMDGMNMDGIKYNVIKVEKKELMEYINGNGDELWNNFHFLIYICKVLDVDTALSICDSIIQQQPIDDLIKELLLH
uniref:NPL4 family, putative zinc binding region/NPL4 family, putative n=2 Tax=Theileria annulata TaxID=5874 RepID=A0A3B0MLE3_THEAN